MRNFTLPLLFLCSALTACVQDRPTNPPGDGKFHRINRAIDISILTQDAGTQDSGVVDTGVPETGTGLHDFIVYNGGPLITGTTNVYIIWYGNWKDNSAKTIIPEFVTNISGSPYFEINTKYYELSVGKFDAGVSASGVGPRATYVSNSVALVQQIDDNYSLGSNLTSTDIKTIVANTIEAGKLPLDTNAVYFVLTSKDVSESYSMGAQFCSAYCGWHNHFKLEENEIKYSFVGDVGACPDACVMDSNALASPNNNIGADGMISVIAHELEETVTDPELNGWHAPEPWREENADVCAWTWGTTYVLPNGSIANMKLGARDYLVQQNWVLDPSGDFCGLKLK